MIRKPSILCAALALTLGLAGTAAAQDLPRRGKYVFAAAGGCACHTPPEALGLNAGGRKFEGPFGVVYSRNITPDPETGIGKWTDVQIIDAIRRGERPDGSRLFPIHPFEYLANVADDVPNVATEWQHPSWHYKSVYNYSTIHTYPLATVTVADGSPLSVTLNGGGSAYVRFSVPAGQIGQVTWDTPATLVSMSLVRLK